MGNVVLGGALVLIAVIVGFIMGYGTRSNQKDIDK